MQPRYFDLWLCVSQRMRLPVWRQMASCRPARPAPAARRAASAATAAAAGPAGCAAARISCRGSIGRSDLTVGGSAVGWGVHDPFSGCLPEQNPRDCQGSPLAIRHSGRGSCVLATDGPSQTLLPAVLLQSWKSPSGPMAAIGCWAPAALDGCAPCRLCVMPQGLGRHWYLARIGGRSRASCLARGCLMAFNLPQGCSPTPTHSPPCPPSNPAGVQGAAAWSAARGSEGHTGQWKPGGHWDA